MLTTAVFRAVENNIDVVRAANSGVAARIDRYGIVHGETPMFETAARIWKIKNVNEAAGDGLTFYTRHGDVFVIACAVFSSLLLAASIVDGLRKRRSRFGIDS
jgi:apolipoprotein N-acyltransferase